MLNKAVHTFETGLVRTNKTKQPANSYSYALNTVPGDEITDRSSRGNEKGFEEAFSTELKEIPYNLLGYQWLGTDNYVFFIKNKEGSAVFNEIWYKDSTGQRLIAEGADLNFQDNHEITSTYRVDYKGDRLVYFVDGLNYDRVINADTASTITNIDLLSINVNFSSATISASVNNDGGILKTGQYFIAISYSNESGYETPIFGMTKPISINRDRLVNDPNRFAVNGDEGDQPTTKSITLDITNLDQDFEFYNLYIVQSLNTFDRIYSVSNLVIDSASVTKTLSGGELVERTDISINDITVPNINYYASEMINQKENRLIRGNSKIKADLINYQEFANNIKVGYTVEESLMFTGPVATGISQTPNFGQISEEDGPIENAQTAGVFSTYLADTANISVSATSFMRDEVYSLGISLELDDGSETAVFHIPGRALNNLSTAGSKVGEYNRALTAVNVNLWDNDIIDGDLRWRTRNTATKLSAASASGDLAYWRSNEIYPDGYGFPTDGEKAPNGRSYVRHHKMPSDVLRPIYRTVRTGGDEGNFGTNGYASTSYNVYKSNIVLNFSNIVIPAEYADIVKKIKLHYTPRNESNRSILSKGLMYMMDGVTEDGGTRIRPSFTFNNWKDEDMGNSQENTIFQFVSPEVSFKHKSAPIFGNRIKMLGLQRSYPVYTGRQYGASVPDAYLINLNNNTIRDPDNPNNYAVPYTETAVGVGLYLNMVPAVTSDYSRPIEDSFYVDSNFFGNTNGLTLNMFGQDNTAVINLSSSLNVTAGNYPSAARSGKLVNVFRKVNYTGLINRTAPFDDAFLRQDNLYWDNAPYVAIVSDNQSLYGDVLGLTYTTLQSDIVVNNSGTFSTTVRNGDTYIDMHHIKKGYNQTVASYANYDGLAITPVGGIATNPVAGIVSTSFISFICESDINMRMRREDPQTSGTYYPLSLSSASSADDVWRRIITSEYINIEDFYNKKSTKLNFANNIKLARFANEESNRYETRVIYSDQQLLEDQSDNYRIVRANNYRDLPANRGPITQSFVKQDKLYVLTRDAVFDVYSSNKTLETFDTDTITVGTGEFFGLEPVEIMSIEGGFGGTSSKFSLSESPYGYLFVDNLKNKVILFNDNLKDINIAGLNENFNLELYKQFPEAKDISGFDNPVSGVGIITKYDPELHRLLITKKDYKLIDSSGTLTFDKGHIYRNGILLDYNNPAVFENKSFTVSYDPISDNWISYHSYIPDNYISHSTKFIIKEDSLLKLSGANLYQENMPFIIEVVFNDNPLVTKVNDSMTVNLESEVIDGSTINDFFNELVVYNEQQSSGVIELTRLNTTKKEKNWNISKFLDISTNIVPKKLFSTDWADIQTSYPIDKVINPASIDTSKPWYIRGRFRDKYFVARFIYKNFENNKIICNFVSSNYRISNR